MADPMTLGVEEEFHLVDLSTRALSPRAPQVLAALPGESFCGELMECVVETNTAVCTTLDDLRREIAGLRRAAVGAAAEQGLGVAASGTVGLCDPDVLTFTRNPRFERMAEEYQLLVRDQLICGAQVHATLPDRDVAVAVGQRLAPWLPVLLAVSGSSPFWKGDDTGYASTRTLVWQRWPTAGWPGRLDSAADYDALVDRLIASGAASDRGMVYFDVRPSAHVPTLELRLCDSTSRIDDLLLVAGLFRALVRRERASILAGEPLPVVPSPLYRSACWRAARSGLSGDLIELVPNGDRMDARPAPAPDVLRGLVSALRPELEEEGDWPQVCELVEQVLRDGTSAARQREVVTRGGTIADATDLVLADTAAGTGADVPAGLAAFAAVSGGRG